MRYLEKEVISKAKVNTEVNDHENIKYWVDQLGNYNSDERKQLNAISDDIVNASVKEVN